METETTITAVERSETRNGNTRFVVRDADGREYTTFRPSIGEQERGPRRADRLAPGQVVSVVHGPQDRAAALGSA